MSTQPGSTSRCAALSRALDEPLAGTAPVGSRWLCLEHRGAWPREVTAHPDPAVAALTDRAAAAGWRVLLVRRPGRRGPRTDGPARVFLTDTLAQHTTTLTVAGPGELAALSLPPHGDLPGTPVPGPLLLVCTHGRRDRCCALDGRALCSALNDAGEPDVWECTHLGGHRFAPTALVLPTGYLYGRLDLPAAVAVRKSAGLGEVEAALCRGRSSWSPAGQVAELAVRTATGLRDAAALTVLDDSGPDVVVGAADGRRWTVAVRPRGVPTRPASCGAEPAPGAALVASQPCPLQ
jgi:hypothetical protein